MELNYNIKNLNLTYKKSHTLELILLSMVFSLPLKGYLLKSLIKLPFLKGFFVL